MSNYISREAAFGALQQAAKKHGAMGNHEAAGIYASAASVVAELPAADVAPVVPSKWVLLDDEERPRCAKCEHIALLETDELYSLSNYCPNCGACMKEERHDLHQDPVAEDG